MDNFNPFAAMEGKYNYESLKALAKEMKVGKNDLLSLAPLNDPFYCGNPFSVKWAEWFVEVWHRLGFAKGAHLKQVHYRAISQNPPILRPDGSPYENTVTNWTQLAAAGKYARYLGLIDYDSFVDRRAPDPMIFTKKTYSDPEPGIDVYSDWDPIVLPDLPDLPILPRELPDLPRIFATGYEGVEQDYHVEVWIEKSTMNDILIPICRECGVNLVTGVGELSLTAVDNLMDRIDKPTRILYISDWDPKGLGMPVSIARKIEYYQRNEGRDDIEICLQPIILTLDQVKHYRLPKTPIKPTENQLEKFQNIYGEGAVELDALEALVPGEFERIVEEAIMRYYEPKLIDRAIKEKLELQDDLDNLYSDIRNVYDGELQAIDGDYKDLTAEFEVTRQEFAKLAETFRPKLEAYRSRLASIMDRAESVHTHMKADLDNIEVDFNDYPLPEAEVDGDPASMLYDSNRDYFSQLEAYKSHQAGN